MKTPFRFPLLAGDVASFCHPSPMHELHEPHILDGDLVAGNGFLAIKAARGRWMASDFTPAAEGFICRLARLPWGTFPPDDGEWRALDDVRGHLFRFATHSVWRDNHTLAPSPVWEIGGQHNIRLSHLQHLSRLPQCEVYAGAQCRDSPAYFRYNGGRVIVPTDQRLTTHSFSIFAPRYDIFTGQRCSGARTRQIIHGGHIKGWPPADPID